MRDTTAGETQVLVFDVLGSLLDEDAGQLAAVRRESALQGPAGDAFVESWSVRFHELVTAVRDGHERYEPPEVLYARTARDVAAEARLTLPDEAVRRLARFGRRLEPFPEVPAALDALSRRFPLVALTNAGTAQACAMSAHAGLRWSSLVSGEVVRAYKPDPQMYRYTITALDLSPQRCVFVAAHEWDLVAAAEHGFVTAYLDRAGDRPDARADMHAPDLAALARQLR